MQKIKDFFPFTYQLKQNSVVRYLFLKQHEGKDDIKPSDRTLYIVNVPQFFNESCLTHLFSEFGSIERIFVHQKPTSSGETSTKNSKFLPQTPEFGSQVAYIVFTKPSSLKRVFNANVTKIVPREKYKTNIGRAKWTRAYNSCFVNVKDLDEEIKNFMSGYDKTVEEEKEKEKMGEEPDEEGWVTVSKFSKKPKIPRIESINKRILRRQAAAQSKLVRMNFYKNQLRDAKMEQIKEMRKRFEKDKAQIALMRSSRKFKPF